MVIVGDTHGEVVVVVVWRWAGGCYRPSVRIPVLAHPILSISCLTAEKYPAPLQPKNFVQSTQTGSS